MMAACSKAMVQIEGSPTRLLDSPVVRGDVSEDNRRLREGS